MGIALAVLVLAAISGGFVGLMLLPLIFIWLAISVYKEPWKESAPEGVSERAMSEGTRPLAPMTPQKPAEEAVAERPRVMVAGRRRPS